MTIDEQIAKLEALLALVRSRSRAKSLPPATNGAKVEAALAPARLPKLEPSPELPRPPPAPPPPPQSPLDVPTPMAGFRPSPVPPAPSPSVAPEARPPSVPKVSQRPEAPPFFLTPLRTAAQKPVAAPVPSAPPAPLAPPESSQVRPHEPPPMEVVELEVDPDPSIPPPSLVPVSGAEVLESRSRLVSAPPVALEQDEEDGPPGGYDSAASDPTIEIAAAEVSRTELEAIEASEADEAGEGHDRAPTSSRRPISLEEKMSEPDDVPLLHTPPPESGALPAASPAIDVGFEPPAAPPAVPAPRAIQAAPTQVEVAAFVGRAPDATAPSFGDLLDATLAL